MNRIKTFTKEEILGATSIRLDKNWDIFLTPFMEYNKVIHEDDCKHLLADYNSDVECTCTPKIIPSVMTKILGWLKEEEKYYQCNIPEEKSEIPEDSWKLPYDTLQAIPILAEDIINGLCTIAEMLKAYEISGNTDYDFFKLRMPDGQVLEGKELSRVIYS